jgi:hypothetical protein
VLSPRRAIRGEYAPGTSHPDGCQSAAVAVLEVLRQRAEGEPVETPPLPAVGANPMPGGETLTAAFEGWKRQRERAPGTVTEYERAIRLFVELHGDLPVVQIRKSHARLFREALQDVPQKRTGKLLKAPLPEMAQWGREHPNTPKITASTVNKLLGGVQAVAVWARDNGVVPDDVPWADPFAKMRLGESEAVRGGAPFEIADLQMIFKAPAPGIGRSGGSFRCEGRASTFQTNRSTAPTISNFCRLGSNYIVGR